MITFCTDEEKDHPCLLPFRLVLVVNSAVMEDNVNELIIRLAKKSERHLLCVSTLGARHVRMSLFVVFNIR